MCAQLGSGNNSGYPTTIDTRQTFINAAVAAPDSASRLDAELANDTLHAILQIEHTLGANPQGSFASLAARLQQFLPGGGTTPLYFGFTATTSATIPGTVHHLATTAPLFQVYDNSTPLRAIQPGQVTVNTLSYDVTFVFATAQTGAATLANPMPQYVATFTNQTTVVIPGTTHLLGTADLFCNVYTTVGPDHVWQLAPTTIHPTTYDVTVTFVTPQSGQVILSAAGPRYATTFTSQTTVTIPGALHGFETAALLAQVFDAGTPRQVFWGAPFTVDPITFDVVFSFATPQSGRIVLVKATEITGSEFEVRDAGITDSTAVRLYSQNGYLVGQMGSAGAFRVENQHGAEVAFIDALGNLIIYGNGFNPTGSNWTAWSDARLKHRIRPFDEGLATLLALEPVRYRFNGQGGIRPSQQDEIGLIADAVQAVAPYMVGTKAGHLEPQGPAVDLLTLDTTPLLYLLLNAVKELHAIIASLEARLQALESPPQEAPDAPPMP